VKTKRMSVLTGALILTIGLSACGDDDNGNDGTAAASPDTAALSGTVRIDGSSTVAPLSEAAAEGFQAEQKDVRVTVGTSGTGGGFEKFCAGETDISNASRAIEDDEKAACAKKGITFDEFTVANDGLSVVVSPENDWATCLTVDQLKKVWDKGSKVNNWNQIDPKFPDEKLELFGAGTDSGTFDYFTDAINGEEGRSRSDYGATEDDNVTVQGVQGSKGGLGYFGLSYLEQNEGKVRGVAIKNDSGECVEPTSETVKDASYTPLSRPLFIYVNGKALKDKAVEAFVKYYVENTDTLTEQALFVSLTDAQKTELQKKLETLQQSASATR
jgi:phosphate transport system substrate-binding protein